MNEKETQSEIEEMAELVKKLCLADSHIHIYSIEHPTTKLSIRSAYEGVNRTIERKGKLAIGIGEKEILFQGIPVDERNPVVARFATHLNQIHVDNLFFKEGLTYEEFEEFFKILGCGPKYVNEHGGIQNLFKERGITHIEMKEVSYVMITEDEKVVSKDTKVLEEGVLERLAGDREIVEYMIKEVMEREKERKWLINEIKNNPKKMSHLIAEGIELAISRAERGILGGEETIETLLENIKLIGQSLIAEEASETEEDARSLEEAIITLESEVKSRSKKLMSSKAAAGFINEILTVITSFSDQARAKRISDEFLKGERSLKQTEKLLRKFTPTETSTEEFLIRVQNLLIQRGIGEEELMKVLNKLKEKKEKRREGRKRKIYLDKVILEGVQKRLSESGLEESQLQKITESLTTFFDYRLKEQKKESILELERLAEEVRRREISLEALNYGVILWDKEGVIDFIDRLGGERVGLSRGDHISEELLDRVQRMKFPMPVIDSESAIDREGMEKYRTFLLAIEKVIKDDQEEIIGVTLQKSKETSA
ncbi:TPA: hypothetical protein DCX15_04700 [bacterium]|nr:hypothetical protein [bacterium]